MPYQQLPAHASAASTADLIVSRPTSSARYLVGKIKRHKTFAGVALLLLLAGPIGLTTFLTTHNSPTLPPGAKKSIAVLPLKPINIANRDEVYEIGIADSLIHRLSSMKGFVVRPLSATRKYADVVQDPVAAGREQQADYVLASNYQLAGGRIRVTLQLFGVASGQIEETYKIEKDASDIFAMQDEIASEVGYLLMARFATTASSPAARRGTTNEEAYRLYQQGMYFYDKRTGEDASKAVRALDEAVRIDPAYAQAWAGKAHAHRYLANFTLETNIHEEYKKSIAAINKALALDQNLSEAHSALCENKTYYEYDFEGAEAACKRAIELNPDSPLAHNIYARFLLSRGRFDEMIAEIKTAIDLDPTSFFHQLAYTVGLTYARRNDEGVRQLERIAEMNPNNATGYFWLVAGGLTMQRNDSEIFERLARFQRMAKIDEEVIRLYKTIFQKTGWHGVLREQTKRFDKDTPNYFFAACLNSQVGDKDKAFEYLEKSYQRREMWMAYLQVEPRFDPLRSDPRFQELVSRVESSVTGQ